MEKLSFPVTFPKCKICDSEDLIAGSVVEDLKTEDKIGPEKMAAIELQVMAIDDPSRPSFTVTQLMILYDICAGCGIKRAVYIDKRAIPSSSLTAGKAQNADVQNFLKSQ